MLGRIDEARAEYLAEPVEDFRLAGHRNRGAPPRRCRAAEAAHARLVAELGDRVLYQQAQVLAQWGRRDPAIASARPRPGAGRFRADLRAQRSLPGPAAGRRAVREVAESPRLRHRLRQPAPSSREPDQGNHHAEHDDGTCGRAGDAGAGGLREEGRGARRAEAGGSAEAAPADAGAGDAGTDGTPPADANSEDAEQSGGDKVKP